MHTVGTNSCNVQVLVEECAVVKEEMEGVKEEGSRGFSSVPINDGGHSEGEVTALHDEDDDDDDEDEGSSSHSHSVTNTSNSGTNLMHDLLAIPGTSGAHQVIHTLTHIFSKIHC